MLTPTAHEMFRLDLAFLADQYNQEIGNTGAPKVFQLVVVHDRDFELFSSLPSHQPINREEERVDWSHAHDVAVTLFDHQDCRTIMDPQLRNHPSVIAGARAVLLPGPLAGLGLSLGLCCRNANPNASEAIGVAILTNRGLLLESGLQEIARISGSDPRKILPFSWKRPD